VISNPTRFSKKQSTNSYSQNLANIIFMVVKSKLKAFDKSNHSHIIYINEDPIQVRVYLSTMQCTEST